MDNYIVSMRVACEKGTYIRTLCNDIGEKLGCGATMTELKRTRVDMFDIDKALKLSEIQLLKEAGRLDTAVLPTDIVFLKYEKITVGSSLLKQVLNGNKLAFDTFKYIPSEDEKIRLYDESGNFLALYIRTGEELKVCGMFC
jgi:tRNA pseudouridine55 synthase